MDSFNYYNLERTINSKLFGLEDPDELTIEDYMKLGDVLEGDSSAVDVDG